MEHIFRILDFNVYDDVQQSSFDSSDDENEKYKDKKEFIIQMFGLNEKGESCSITVEGYKPFFYVLVNDSWNIDTKNKFLEHIKQKIGKYYENSITDCVIIKRKKLYGFDAGKEHKFIKFEFANTLAFNRTKNLWYSEYGKQGRSLLKNGYNFNNTNIILYEANIPPLLRFFHIKDISPSGWVALPKKKTIHITSSDSKKTMCKHEFIINTKNIIPLNDKETRVPYKICSFDIEASSSHGDFPVPVKSYKKLATNIVEYFENLKMDFTPELCKNILRRIILAAFGYENMQQIDIVYPKNPPKSKEEVERMCDEWFSTPVRNFESVQVNSEMNTLENLFEKMANDDSDDEYDYKSHVKQTAIDKKMTIVDLICDKKFPREDKLREINETMFMKERRKNIFPELEGDKVTFIGSTFMNYGDQEPCMNHCIVLNTCSELPIQNSIIESYNTEKDVLLAWQRLIQREDPDIIIGYNIFGFDYMFMFKRAEENDCIEEFLKLSRNKDEICGTPIKDDTGRNTGKYKLEESSIQIASGQHDLRFIKMNGRLQVDLYNFYRREANLTSYKLDYVAGNFIGDFVKAIDHVGSETEIKTSNMTGLLVGSYIHFEEIGHSVDYYADGAKFIVTYVSKSDGKFKIDGIVNPDFSKKVRWCLAKDDVSPKDIFRMTNGTADDRAIIAKYCIQDCNLVHYLFNKSDVLTGFIEMAKICSVPINFLVMRGQGIKLTSYIAKKCREKATLMPVIEKGGLDEGYEGAIVLDPKCDLYLDNPVACVDYASLYPSSMISENLSHDSKVWTREYDLDGNLIEEWGEKDENGNFKYDNLPGYEYVDITYDTYRYIRKKPTAAAEKVKCGQKTCRFAQPHPDKKGGEGEAIMPSILKELLKARKDTRKLIPQQSDEFMKQVLEQRQLGYKVTANSLYGQCGAKTSTFYEKDIAACTTATGRKLLTYAKRIIEECYGDSICNTEKYGPVLTKAEYIYGDSVSYDTPVYIRVNNEIEILTIEQLGIKYGNDQWFKCLEPGKQEKEVCELDGIETWSDKGWTKMHRIIRHELAPHKKMVRIVTKYGIVEVTDDHSLLNQYGKEVSPNDLKVGDELLYRSIPSVFKDNCSWIKDLEPFKPYYNVNNLKKIFIKYLDNILSKKSYVEIKGEKDQIFISIDGLYNNLLYSEIFSTAQMFGFHVEIEKEFNMKIQISSGYAFNGEKKFKNSIIDIYEFTEDYIINCDIYTYDRKPYVYDLTTDNHHFAAGVGNLIVHNTDSVFFTFNLQTPEGKPIRGKEALEITIELAQEAGHLASSFLKGPHDLEYEKTFMPFCLLSKKRYVGMLYETDPNKCKRKEMGIVLKRRDNAPIVKDVYGGIIDILMKQQNIKQAIDFLKSCLQNIVDEKYPIEKLIITKSLRSGYKNPQSIAHKVLADRITARDPGNKPGPGDRIPYVYINNKDKKALQGEKIETPSFIIENNLKIDYSFYITNQIMKPVQQVFALVLEKIWEMQNKKSKIAKFKKDVDILRNTTEVDKFEDKLESLKNKEVKILLFDEYLRETNNEKEGVQNLNRFFSKK
jgi:DNA polymerase elongation subunit (family B)